MSTGKVHSLAVVELGQWYAMLLFILYIAKGPKTGLNVGAHGVYSSGQCPLKSDSAKIIRNGWN